MNIGQLAEQTGVSADTLRYYEREGLIEPPARAANGYRSYREADAQRVRFVRSAQALGFTLAEIRGILPQLNAGRMDRRAIEARLQAKIAEIDGHIRQMQPAPAAIWTCVEKCCRSCGCARFSISTVRPPSDGRTWWSSISGRPRPASSSIS